MAISIDEAIDLLEKNYGSGWLNELSAEWEKDNPKTIPDVDDWNSFVKYSRKDFKDEDLCEFYGRWIELRANFYYVIKDRGTLFYLDQNQKLHRRDSLQPREFLNLQWRATNGPENISISFLRDYLNELPSAPILKLLLLILEI